MARRRRAAARWRTAFAQRPMRRRLTRERATGVEPATSSLGSWHSTTELRPQTDGRTVAESFRPGNPGAAPSRATRFTTPRIDAVGSLAYDRPNEGARAQLHDRAGDV